MADSEGPEATGTLATMRLHRALEVLRVLEPEMPLQRAVAFLVIAHAPQGCTMKHIAEQLGMYLSTANRNVAALGDWHWRGKRAGLGLIRAEPDPVVTTRHIMKLTPKGKRVVRSLAAALGER